MGLHSTYWRAVWWTESTAAGLSYTLKNIHHMIAESANQGYRVMHRLSSA